MSKCADEIIKAERLVFPIRRISRWYDLALTLHCALGLVLSFCPFIVAYMINDAPHLSFTATLWQSMLVFLFVFSISVPSLFWRWQTFRFERLTIEESGCSFVDMLGRRCHLPWAQVAGVGYNVLFDALILENGNRRVFVQNSFVEPDLVMKYILDRIPDSARLGSVVEFLCGAFLHGRIETTGTWTHRFICQIAYVRWGGETRVPKP